MSAERQRTDYGPVFIILALFLLALILRFWKLGVWTFDGDEIYTLRDSLHLKPGNPRPLLFLLNHYLVGPLVPLNEFGLRLVPALAGALAIPVLYWVGASLVGPRAALFATLLLALNPMHIYQSQYARYWSLVFLLCAIYPYALYFGVVQRSGRWLGLGIVTGVLAVLAHPVSLLLLGGLGLYGLLRLRREVLGSLWSKRLVRWMVVLLLVLAVIAVVHSFDLLHRWMAAHAAKTRIPDQLRGAPQSAITKQVVILLNYTEGLTLPVTVAGLTGLYLLWRNLERSVALLLLLLLAVPMTIILLLSTVTPVSVTYLLPTAPVLFLTAGVLIDRLTQRYPALQPRWLVTATVTILALSAGLPSVVSQYRDGRRYDLRGAARWLEPRLTSGDQVYSLQSKVVGHYLKQTPVQPLAADSMELVKAEAPRDDTAPNPVLWVVTPAPSHAFRTNLKRGGLSDWLFGHCQLRASLGVGRIDFRQQYLHIYRCPPLVESPRTQLQASQGPAAQDRAPTSSAPRLRAKTSR